MRNVLRGKEISFKDQADPHGIPSGGGGVDGRPEGVLHRKKRVRAESKVKLKAAQSCPTLYDPMDYTVHKILQARILEWIASPFSRGSSQPRDRTQVSHIAGGFFTS